MPSVKPMIQDGFDYREMTDEEFAQYENDQALSEKNLNDLKAKAKAKQAILDRLGLTNDELLALLS